MPRRLQSITAIFCNTAAMTYDHILPLIGYAFATSVTPGPNNMMLLASGANFGLRRSLPHMLGISGGHAFMVLVMGLGLAQLIHALPQVLVLLKGLAVIYVIWLAWKIAHSAAPQAAKTAGKPLTFLQAAAFQWVNPKAIAMAISAVTVYGGDGSFGAIAVVALVFASVNLPSVSVWTIAGEVLRQFLSNPWRLRVFNWSMALLLILSMLPVLWA
jgi:threonine/homoserine/homoserine lactone efflux protein